MIIEPLLAQLLAARRDGRLIEAVSADMRPATLQDAYDTADRLAALTGRSVAGWKIGATTPRGQKALGLSEPFGGRIFADTVWHSPAVLAGVQGVLTIGAEIVLHLNRDLDARPAPLDAAAVATAVDRVGPALELNQPSFRDPFLAGGLCLIADNGVNVGLVLGEARPALRTLHLTTLAVSLSLNAEVRSHGCAHDTGFDPLEALAWLANDRARRGDPLRAGQWISTGDLVGPVEARAGDTVEGNFGPLGVVRLELQA
jgi:2-keto-4-pentenoate hydratase